MGDRHRSTAGHLVWLLIAGSAFVLGAWSRRAPSEPAVAVVEATSERAETASDGPSRSAPERFEALSEIVGERETMANLSFRVASLFNPMERRLAMLRYANALQPAELERAVMELDGLSASGLRSEMLGLVVERWAEREPVAALANAQTRQFGERIDLTQAALRGWAVSDPPALAEWIDTHVLSGRTEQVAAVVDALDRRGRWREAGDLITSVQSASTTFLDPHLRAGAAEDLESTATWVRSLPDGMARFMGFGILTRVLTERDPWQAIEWLDQLEDRERIMNYSNVVRAWIRSGDIVAAGDWVASLPADPQYDGVVGTFAGELARVDPDIALRIIDSMTDERRRSLTLRQQLNGLAGMGRPDAAAVWITHITNEPQRERSAINLYRRLDRQQPDMARQFAEHLQVEAPAVWMKLPIRDDGESP